MKLETFQDVLTAIEKNKTRPFHLMVGNGFSMAYDPKIFSYNALYNFVESLQDATLTKLFGVVNTADDQKRIDSMQKKFKCKMHIFDAKTANVWK